MHIKYKIILSIASYIIPSMFYHAISASDALYYESEWQFISMRNDILSAKGVTGKLKRNFDIKPVNFFQESSLTNPTLRIETIESFASEKIVIENLINKVSDLSSSVEKRTDKLELELLEADVRLKLAINSQFIANTLHKYTGYVHQDSKGYHKILQQDSNENPVNAYYKILMNSQASYSWENDILIKFFIQRKLHNIQRIMYLLNAINYKFEELKENIDYLKVRTKLSDDVNNFLFDINGYTSLDATFPPEFSDKETFQGWIRNALKDPRIQQQVQQQEQPWLQIARKALRGKTSQERAQMARDDLKDQQSDDLYHLHNKQEKERQDLPRQSAEQPDLKAQQQAKLENSRIAKQQAQLENQRIAEQQEAQRKLSRAAEKKAKRKEKTLTDQKTKDLAIPQLTVELENQHLQHQQTTSSYMMDPSHVESTPMEEEAYQKNEEASIPNPSRKNKNNKRKK